jgi:hypothetical protein
MYQVGFSDGWDGPGGRPLDGVQPALWRAWLAAATEPSDHARRPHPSRLALRR